MNKKGALLSIIFIDYDKTLELVRDSIPDEFEFISIASNTISLARRINFAIRMSSGQYVCMVDRGDLLNADFFDEVRLGIASNRDAIVFDTVDSNGVITKYTTSYKRFNLGDDLPTLPLQYFHPAKRRIINSIMITEDTAKDPFVFYSKKLTNVAFNEYRIDKVLMRHDAV